jgi:hypothetical protein
MGDRLGVWLACLVGLALAVCGGGSGGPPHHPGGADVGRGDWWMFGHDPQHTRRSPFVGAQTPTVKWKCHTSAMVDSSPVIGADGTVYVGSYDHNSTLSTRMAR